VFHGQGGYGWEIVYNMPIWLRKFTFKKIQDHYTKQNEEVAASSKKGNSTVLVDSTGNVNKEAAKQFNPGKAQYR
jgi:hypothetical protein